MTPDPVSSPPIALDYGAAPSRGRKLIKRGIALTVLILLTFGGWRWGPFAWHQARILYWQRQCLKYRPPADQVVYEEEPAGAAKLLAASGDYTVYLLNRGSTGDNGAVTTRPSTLVKAAALVPQPWRNFTAATSNGPMPRFGWAYGAIAFMGERTSPGGNRRLLAIHYFEDPCTFTSSFVAGFNYVSPLYVLATFTTPAKPVLRGYSIDVLSGYPRQAPNVRMYAGQPDPNDKSHFTIRYQMWAQSDLLDGYLDDHDNVTLRQRNPPQWPR